MEKCVFIYTCVQFSGMLYVKYWVHIFCIKSFYKSKNFIKGYNKKNESNRLVLNRQIGGIKIESSNYWNGYCRCEYIKSIE
ncbi:hypothetical protein GCM10010896_08720 [Mammaliicoccus stepanovicii]|nr:hypothetical protein GCM10010896_08720 [Mammaliicoccus stepanovicii]